jgi:DNA-binding NarL/FixJ family response regulator
MRIVLIDDDPQIRLLVRLYLEMDPAHEVVGEAGDILEAVAVTARQRPQVVVTDLVMGAKEGAEPLLRELHNAAPEARIVIFSGWDADRPAGADAYVLKGGPIDTLLDAINDSG